MQITITVHFQNDKLPVLTDLSETLGSLKRRISLLIDTPINELSVYFKNRYLTDDRKTIRELKIHNNDTVYLKKRNLQVEPGQKNDMTMEMLKNPMIKNVLKNPEMMKGMIKSMPGFKKSIKKNPELKNILNNPSALQEFEKLADNPEYYEQQLKNIDIAMSKLENIPGGFNMMNSLVKDVRDPFMRIMDNTSTYNLNPGNNQINNEILPNVWISTKKKRNHFVVYKNEINEIMKLGFNDMNLIANTLDRTNGDIDSALVILYEEQVKE